MDKEPTETISCGKCSAVNQVPFGLERFKCYGCGSTVAITRAPSGACAAASPTAVYYEGLQAAASAPTTSVSAASHSEGQASRRQGDGVSSFFGKLQKTVEKTVDRTMQKVERAFQAQASPPVADKAAAQQRAMTLEEEQLQWALNASLSERQPASSSPAPGEAAEAAQRLEAAEARAWRAERELGEARAREARVERERDAVRRQLADNERLLSSLTAQLDACNAQREEQERRRAGLESALVLAEQQEEQDRAQGEDFEQQGTVAQLLARVAELEASLLKATHFASCEQAPERPLM